MKKFVRLLRLAILPSFFTVFAGGCATHLPAPPLVISTSEVTYVKVVPAPQIVKIYMTPITIGGAVQGGINQNVLDQSMALYEAIRDNSRTQALQTRFRDRVIQEAKVRGLTLQNGDGLPDATSAKSDQIIYLKGFQTLYYAKTMVNSYSPVAATFIASSRDPLIQPGQTRFARSARVQIDDSEHSFATAAGVVENRETSLDGIEMAIDALAVKVATELHAASKP